MKTSNQNIMRAIVIISLMIIAAFTRLIPHPWNFTAIMAVALFGGAKFRPAAFAVVVPLLVMFITDIFLGFYSLIPLVYGCVAFTALVGMYIGAKSSPVFIIGGSLVSSIMFFLVTNGGVWYHNAEFTQNFQGLLTCYEIAIPFFKNQVFGDLFFNALLFGSFALVSRRVLVPQRAS